MNYGVTENIQPRSNLYLLKEIYEINWVSNDVTNI